MGAALQAIAYCLMCFGGPYPLFVIAFAINGLGLGLQDAQANTVLARLPNADIKVSLAHAVYGLGATVAPLVSTQFVIRVSRFYLYYTTSIGIAAGTCILLLLVFRGRTEDEVCGVRPREADYEQRVAQGKEGERGSAGKMGRLLKIPAVHYMAFYLLIYVGSQLMTLMIGWCGDWYRRLDRK
jgi:fucose permease